MICDTLANYYPNKEYLDLKKIELSISKAKESLE